MTRHTEIGKKGEQYAKEYLVNKGYEILEQNWRYSKAEIDIIGKFDTMLVFVEVKTRSSNYFGPPEAFVSSKKMKLVAKAASAYMYKNNYDWEIRFDVISVLLSEPGPPRISHFEDAFFPGLKY